MTIALVEGILGAGNAPPNAAAFTVSAAVGDVLVGAFTSAASQSNPGTIGVSDNVNTGAWSQIGSTFFSATSGISLGWFWKKCNVAGTPTVTATETAGAYAALMPAHFNGFVGIPTVDASVTLATHDDTGSSTTVSVSPVVTGFNKELLLFADGINEAGSMTPVSGWNKIVSSTWGFAYAVEASVGTSNPVSSTITANYWAAMVVGIYDAPTNAPGSGSLAVAGNASTLVRGTILIPNVARPRSDDAPRIHMPWRQRVRQPAVWHAPR